MPEFETQNIAIVLDASRSMFRKDYTPNRFEACKQAIVSLIRSRTIEDQKSGFALIIAGKEVKTVTDFGETGDADSVEAYLNDLEVGGSSKVTDGIGLAIKLHIEDIRKAGAKIPKILVFSDGKLTPTKAQPTKIAEIAHGLEIKIDTVRLGEVEHFNMLKRVSELTEGKHYYCHDTPALLLSAKEIADSNKGKKYQKSKNYTNILEKIAVSLKTESELSMEAADIAERIRGNKEYKKCGICFIEQDPVTKAEFRLSGRYCPNCGKGYHIHCMAQWAKNDKESNGRVCRCPHCFYLLKVEGEVQQAQKIRDDFKRTTAVEQSMSSSSQYYAKQYVAKELGDTALYSACPVCNTIFDENEQVIKCGNPECNVIYHLDCFEQVNNNPCKTCGKKMVRSF
jgi:hypothetical protein